MKRRPGLALVPTILAGCSASPPLPYTRVQQHDRLEGRLLSDEAHRIEVFRRACPSVVQVSAVGLRRDPARFNVLEIPIGMGTGVVWDREGHVVTNAHVVGGADEVRVTFKDGSARMARVAGTDARRDIALLKIDAPPESLQPIPTGSSAELRVGRTVLAIGNPFGFDHSLTVGVVSALGREIRTDSINVLQGLIQTDAAINPGNSGGPLLDSGGNLVGINTALVSPSGAFAGIGFAVPVDAVAEAISRILAVTPAQRPGFLIRAAEDGWVRELGLSGVLVLEVMPGGPADRAGLRPTRTNADGELELGDLIVAVDGEAVSTRAGLAQALEGRRVGDEVAVTVRRGTDEVSLRVGIALEGH